MRMRYLASVYVGRARLPAQRRDATQERPTYSYIQTSNPSLPVGMAQAKKSTLMTPDPYHTPGYCGYVPQFKYQIGQTFGNHTHQLLTDPQVPSSSRPVLNDTSPQRPPPLSAKTKEDFFASPLYQQRHRSLGDQKYVAQMVPGYTGYIPKRMHHYGCRYAETCHYALSSFEGDQQKHKESMHELRALSKLQEDPRARNESTRAQNTTPLKPVSDTPIFYLPPYAKQHSISPFYMPDDHPQKHFMSGYTGFVPKARKYLGQSYPIITRNALQDFAGEGKRMRATWGSPVRVFRPEVKTKSLATVYRPNCGLMPHYTGHIPGEKFKYGTTFGSSTARVGTHQVQA